MFLESLDAGAGGEQRRELIKFVEETCFFESLRWMDVDGETTATPTPLSLKMERLLEACKERR